MIEGCLSKDEAIPQPIINRPAKVFKHVISYALDGLYPYPAKYEYELKFLCMSYDVD